MQKLLTIAIPTYDRLDYLLDNLAHLLPQMKKYKNEIELIISDNHSPNDPYPNIFELCSQFGVDIVYCRHDVNIGADQNIEYVANKSSGDYLFILGDDDILSPSFLHIIVPILRTHEYGAIHYGRLIGDANCSNNRIHNSIYEDTLLKVSAKDFIRKCLSAPNLLTSIIVDKECWIKGSYLAKDKYYGYNWFARYYLGALELSKPCLIYYFPLLIMRNPSRVWSMSWPLYAIVGLGDLFKDIDTSVPGVYDLWIQRLHDKRYYSLKRMLRQVYPYRDYYRDKKREFYPHLTKYERAFFNYWLYTPFPRISNRLYCLLFRA